MKLAYLYTKSELTPWKENVNAETLSFLVSQTPSYITADIIHFDGFNDDVLDVLRNYDLIFNLCYGYKDAGQVEVAGWLEHNKISHTASNYESMSKAQDKSMLPDICNSLRIFTPEIFFETHGLDDGKIYIAKPRKGSCHRNITIESGAWMKKYLDPMINDLIIQPYVRGREFSVAVIPSENGQYYMSLPPVEIISESHSDIYIAGSTFGKTYRDLNPILSNDVEDALMEHAEHLHKVIGLKGMSRTDFRLGIDGHIYVLDVNAMPNMDPEKSLMPALCGYHQITISDLIQRMIKNHDYTQNHHSKPISLHERMMFI
jgi:D-alanine-D-alanine ligase